MNKLLYIPDNLQIYCPFSNYIADSAKIFKSKYKVFTRIDGSCSSCVSDIKNWNELALEFSKFNVPIILIIRSDDDFELVKYLCETGGIKEFAYPFFFDRKDEFIEGNSFMWNNKHFETIMTNIKNEMIMFGNPQRNEDIKKMYLEMLDSI